MQGGRGGRGSLFGFDPFADFGGFGGLGRPQSLLSSFFGGRDPFDDPFFTRPFGSPFESVFESSFFRPAASPLTSASPAGFIEQQQPQPNKRRGPIIEEINSDDENAEDGGASRMGDNPRKHSRLDKEPSVQVPDDEADGERNKHIQQRNEFRSRRPQPQCFTFQSSTVSYGGANGAHYTKSMARRAGSDGVTFEEFKEADSTTGQANHRISRGIHSKGHTLSRKLNSDGRVDTMQTLHNLNEEELGGFEQAWEGSAGGHLPGWQQRLEGGNVGLNSHGCPSRGGWALPYIQQTEHLGNNIPQIGGRVDAAHVQQTMERAADHAYMQQTMRSAADHGHMQQTMRRAEDRVHMQQSGRRAPDRGHRGRTRA